jgi:DNA-binding GntR family transcriptional regulator
MIKEKDTIDFKTSAQTAYEIIKENIFNGSLRPGEKLSKRNMAKLTGYSVIPVIEALNKLEFDGLVEAKPLWGSFVAVPSNDKVKDMHVLREAIECQVARILSVNADQKQKKVLNELAFELDRLEYSEKTKNEIMDKHYELHLLMAEYTGHESLVRELERIGLFNQLCRAVETRRVASPVPGNFHSQLLKIIFESDPDTAEKTMREHVNDSLRFVTREE